MKNWFKAILNFFNPKKESYYYRLENLEQDPVKVSYDEVPAELPAEEPVLPEADFLHQESCEEFIAPVLKKARKKGKKKAKKKKNHWGV
jgi:hypothetical protein